MSATLYAPAFAAITGWAGDHSGLRALTAVTLVAGLASTVFAPLTAWLLGPLGWRRTYVVLAALVAATGSPRTGGLRRPGRTLDGRRARRPGADRTTPTGDATSAGPTSGSSSSA